MSLPGIIPAPQFPQVPQLPGVPQLSRTNIGIQETNAISLISAGKLLAQLFVSTSQTRRGWGLLDSDLNAILVPDSFLSFDNRNEWRVMDYPVQQGSFASYNKVATPFEITLRMSKGGSVTDREQFLQTLDEISGTLDLYTLVTPERSYSNLNVTRYEVTRRGANGAYFLTEVDLFLRQVRIITGVYTLAGVDTTNAKSVSAIPSQNLGPVLPQPVPANVVQKAAAAVAGAPN